VLDYRPFVTVRIGRVGSCLRNPASAWHIRLHRVDSEATSPLMRFRNAICLAVLFASGGSQMYVVGEFVGNASEMAAWLDEFNARHVGGLAVVGHFHSSLRSAL